MEADMVADMEVDKVADMVVWFGLPRVLKGRSVGHEGGYTKHGAARAE